MLDGGYGTFALSTSEEDLWRQGDPAAWAWSSDIPHHVTVTVNRVAVVRWDRPNEPRIFERGGVERSLIKFYSYLTDDRLRSNKSVVDHLLGLFRRIRSLSHAAGIADERTTDIFVATLAGMIAHEEVLGHPERFGLAPDVLDLQASLDSVGLAAAQDEISRASGSLSLLKLHPALAVRHAGGQLFQEAHFELLRAPNSLDLFGLIGAPDVKVSSRGGTHYTPPALARSVVEQALGALGHIHTRKQLTICDPACGSGAFLHEVLRALRRSEFKGQLVIVGQDISTAAIAMAGFVLHTALRDWSPAGGVKLKLHAGDSLADLGVPKADLIVMNPPFLAFGSQTPLQREQLRAAMAGAGTARGDLSMAFIIKGLQSLKPGGVLGALFPASLLSLKAAAPWREMLLDLGEIQLLASIGDFGLFSHAMVQVACAVIRNGKSLHPEDATALVSGNDPKATGGALRWLRKLNYKTPSTPITETEWSLFPIPLSGLRRRSTWRFPSPSSDRILRALQDTQLPALSHLFDVRQGIQTGLNEALLLVEDDWQKLPLKERHFFRLATMSDSIQNGLVKKPYRLFFPHSESGPLFSDEQKVRAAVPRYFDRFLEPYRDRLMKRASIVRARRSDWWGLMRPRAWSFSPTPKIVSKFFAAEGGFAGDYEATYVPVMGHAWFPKDALSNAMEESLPITQILAAYVAFFNSTVFVRILASMLHMLQGAV
ncbi:MAG: SAM-dependent DNA methyltransferase [Rhodospirillaceae bacterium]|nr:SAM-dependent DNA methyltransferase [Rhodospirillaceae bacterium]